jgi:hypothetical protein
MIVYENSAQARVYCSLLQQIHFYPYYYLPYPYQRKMPDLYGMMIASLVDNTMAAMKLANNILFANMDVFKTSMQQMRENTTQLSKITTDAAKILEPASSASKT